MLNVKNLCLSNRWVSLAFCAALSLSLGACANSEKRQQERELAAEAQRVAQQKEVEALFSGTIERVDFLPNAADLTEDASESLKELVAKLNEHGSVVLALEGHSDNRGNAADNLELSKHRVMSVVRFLVENGVEPQRLKPYGYGESEPIASNSTEEGRALNRRIEISVVSQ